MLRAESPGKATEAAGSSGIEPTHLARGHPVPTCRIERVACTHVYALIGMLTHSFEVWP